LVATTLQIKKFCEKNFIEYTFQMAGIFDLLTNSRILDVQKPKGSFAGPLVLSDPPEPPKDDRLNELLSDLGEQERFDVMEKIRESDRQTYSPEYIYDKKYKKSPYSFFNDGYDANVDVDIDPNAVSQEFDDFLKLLDGKTNIQDVLKSETLSPYAQDMLPDIGAYREQHQNLPSSFKDFIMNIHTRKA